MVRQKKAEQIGRMKKEMGFSNKQIAWLIYRDRSEKGQRRVRAILSYIKKKELLNDSFRSRFNATQQTTEQSSLRDIVSKLRRRKNFSAVRLWSKGCSVRMIALLLYGDYSEESQNRVYAHISKFRKRTRRRRSVLDFHEQNLRSKDHGFVFPEQNLRSGVGVVNSTLKTCDFEPQPQPQPKPELERMISSFCNGGEAIPTV